jgi:hypothetical protein
VHGRLTVRQGGMYSIQYFSLYLIAILYIISIKVKTNEFSALSRLETAVEPKLWFCCDRLGTEPAEYGNSRGCHNRLVVSRVTATLMLAPLSHPQDSLVLLSYCNRHPLIPQSSGHSQAAPLIMTIFIYLLRQLGLPLDHHLVYSKVVLRRQWCWMRVVSLHIHPWHP